MQKNGPADIFDADKQTAPTCVVLLAIGKMPDQRRQGGFSGRYAWNSSINCCS